MKIFKKISLAMLFFAAFAPMAGASVAEKSAAMAEKDPAGLIMSVTSICVVFVVLLILWLIYAGFGKMFSGKVSLRRKSGKMTPEIAAAIALALQKEGGNETEAAIALALHQYFNYTVHDNESFVITIKRKR